MCVAVCELFAYTSCSFMQVIHVCKYFTHVVHLHQLLPPATKLGQGYIFTGVCHSVNGGVPGPGGYLVPGGVCSWRGLLPGGAWSQGGLLWGVPGPGGLLPGGLLQGGAWSWGVPGPWGVSAPGGCLVETPRMATAAGGTHPTGMHSCF